jgi:hypothetical protein
LPGYLWVEPQAFEILAGSNLDEVKGKKGYAQQNKESTTEPSYYKGYHGNPT